MAELKTLVRDVDRTPYLFTLRHLAAQRGLSLEFILAQPGEPWAERLSDGTVDLIAENYWGLQRERAKGARDGIESVADLRGKRMAIRGFPGTPQALIPAMWLSDIGLADAVELVSIADAEVGRWGHWKAVADGRTEACFITNLYCEAPLAAGLHEVPYERYYFEGMNVTLTTREDVLERRHGDIQALVDSAFETHRAFRNNDPQVLQIMQQECRTALEEHLGNLDDRRLEWVFQVLRDELAEQPVPRIEGVLNAHRVIRDSDVNRRFNPMLMWDLSFARQAVRAQ